MTVLPLGEALRPAYALEIISISASATAKIEALREGLIPGRPNGLP